MKKRELTLVAFEAIITVSEKHLVSLTSVQCFIAISKIQISKETYEVYSLSTKSMLYL